ncbi:MAG TPA: hemolysin family protein [Pelobium sp.]|nr:hemolysin family protein [Pelobium sp.]
MEILIIALLILLNGVFSMSEIALVSSRKFKLEAAAKKGSKNAQRALNLSSNPNTFLSTVQIGITLIGILTGIYSGDKITDDLVQIVEKVDYLQPYADTIAVALIVIVITYFSIVFGELIPKRIGLIFPETIASLVSGPMKVISIITKPFIWLLGITNDLFFKIFGIKTQMNGIISEDEIKAIVKESAENGEILNIEQDIVKRVFALGDRKVRELMTHRSDLIWFDINDNIHQIKTKVENEPHSVYLVSNKTIDQLEGIVYVKDLFINSTNDNLSLKDYLKKPLYIHENNSAYIILEEFKKSNIHYAIVLDEYGSIEGMIVMNDILDSLIGDYDSDTNLNQFKIIKRDDETWLVDGQYSFHEFISYFKLSNIGKNGDFTTIGGLILHELNHIPIEGEKIHWNGLILEILDMDKKRIDKILVSNDQNL